MSFWRLYYHLVWATQKRRPQITPEIEAHLFPYLVSKAAKLGVYVYAINGWFDHVHLVVAIPPKLAISDVVGTLKGSSSHFLNHTLQPNPPFIWQRGYGVLSIGERQRHIAEAYVQRQKEHHSIGTLSGWLEHDQEIDNGPVNSQTLSSENKCQEESVPH